MIISVNVVVGGKKCGKAVCMVNYGAGYKLPTITVHTHELMTFQVNVENAMSEKERLVSHTIYARPLHKTLFYYSLFSCNAHELQPGSFQSHATKPCTGIYHIRSHNANTETAKCMFATERLKPTTSP